MKFTLVLVLFRAQFGGPPERPPEDRWFGRDKAKHFAVSALLQGAGHALGRAAGLDYRDAAWTAAGLTLGVGLGKEFHDRRAGRIFSWRDLTADVAGGGTAAVFVRQLDK